MKKTYINPEMEIVKLQTMQMLAASGEELSGVPFSDTPLSDITFGAREDDYDFE